MILMILSFHRISIVWCYCPVHEVAVHLALCMDITSLTDKLPLNRGDFDKVENREGEAWSKGSRREEMSSPRG